ncbi:hypothetical protein, partial [uncultured Hyphomicrobium sp.]|uniref:hypothetical protein n=1 Tax=uncultured Hyphomicrobium sp. TaxID=194373 RepID=UPI0025FAED07
MNVGKLSDSLSARKEATDYLTGSLQTIGSSYDETATQSLRDVVGLKSKGSALAIKSSAMTILKVRS